MFRLRRSMPELKNYILIENGVIAIIIPHPKPVKGDIVSICKDACEKVKKLPEETKKMARQALATSKTYANKALTMSKKLVEKAMQSPVYQKVHATTMKLVNAAKNHPLAKKYLNATITFLRETNKYVKDINVKELAMKVKNHPIVKKYIAQTKIYIEKTRKYLKDLDFKKIANLTKSYAPIAYNMTKEMMKMGYNVTRNYTMKLTNIAWNVTADLYNSTSPRHALLKAKNYTLRVYQKTIQHYQILMKKHQPKIENLKAFINKQKAIIVLRSQIVIIKARNVSMKLLNMTKDHPLVQDYVNSTIHFINVTRTFINKINVTKIANMTIRYAPLALNMTKDMCKVGFYSTKNFTINVAKLAFNVSIDIFNSTNLRQALLKAKNHSSKAYNETLKLYRILYKQIMAKYANVDKTARALYHKIYKHKITQKSLGHAQRYYSHSMEMIKSRARHFNHIKKYWRHRIAHKVHHMKNLLNPLNWIPPFNSKYSKS